MFLLEVVKDVGGGGETHRRGQGRVLESHTAHACVLVCVFFTVSYVWR